MFICPRRSLRRGFFRTEKRGDLRVLPTVALVVGVGFRAAPAVERAWGGGEHLDLERVARRGVRAVFGAAIPTRAGAECAQKVNLRQEVDVIAGADGRGFHKVLARVAGKPGAHEDVEDIVHMRLCCGQRQPGVVGQGTG